MRKTFTILATFAAASAIVPATASAQAYSPSRVLKSATVNDLKAIVGSLGHTVEAEDVAGDYSIRAHDEEGLKYLLIGTACDVGDVPGCQGIMMQVRFSNDDGQEIVYENLNRANFEQAAVSTWYSPEEETIGVTRYVVLDYGVTMQNIRENVNVLLAVTPLAMDVVRER